MMKFLSLIVCLALFCAVTMSEAIDNDPVLHFAFDEGSGEEAGDSSPSGFVGNITNGSWVDGVRGTAIELNDGAVTVEALGFEPEALTLECWIKPAERIDSGNRIDLAYRLNGGGRPHFTFNRGGLLFGFYFGIKDGDEKEVISTLTAWEAQWTHVAFVQDAEKAQIYVNGELDAEAETGGPVRFDYAAEGLSIGANQGNSNFFNGSIDEFVIWDIALTADQVKEAMNPVSTAVEPTAKLATAWGQIKSVR